MARSAQSKPKSKRGGRRPGAGRPPERRDRTGIPWAKVRNYARLGADRDTIVGALGIDPERLRTPEALARMQQELARGEAQHRIDLLVNVRRLRSGKLKDGKVSAALASLKQSMGWGKPDSGKGGETAKPDNEAAVAEIQRMLGRFRG